jgi:hypothetical protein
MSSGYLWVGPATGWFSPTPTILFGKWQFHLFTDGHPVNNNGTTMAACSQESASRQPKQKGDGLHALLITKSILGTRQFTGLLHMCPKFAGLFVLTSLFLYSIA